MAQSLQFSIQLLGASNTLSTLSEIRDKIKEVATERDKEAAGSAAYQQLTKSLGELKAAQAAANLEVKEAQKAFQALAFPTGSYKDLAKSLSDLNNEYKMLSQAEREDAKIGGEKLKQINQLNDKLKELDAGMGNHQRNVGNYGSVWSSTGTIMGGVSGEVGRMGSAMSQLGMAIATGSHIAGVLALSAAFATLASSAMGYENSLKDLEALSGASGAQLEFMKEKAQELTKINLDASHSITNTAGSVLSSFRLVLDNMPDLSSAPEKLQSVTKDAVIQGKAANMEIGESVKSLTGILNSFELGADNSGRTINVLAAGARVGSASIKELASSFQTVGGTAKLAGVSLEQMAAYTEALSYKMLKGEEAGTKLRNIFLTISDVDSTVSAAGIAQLNNYGVNLDLLRDKSVSFTDKLKELKKIAASPGALEKVFEKQNVVAAETLINNAGSGKLDQMTKDVTGTDEATRQAKVRTETLSNDLENLKNTAIGAFTQIGNTAMPVLHALTGVLGGVVTVVADNVGTIGKLAAIYGSYWVTVKAVTAADQLYNNILAAKTTAEQVYSNILKFKNGELSLSELLGKKAAASMATEAAATEGATIAQEGFNLAAKANPIGLIVAGITAAITAFSYFAGAVTENTARIERLQEANKAVSDSFVKEAFSANELFTTLKSTTASQNERNEAITKLQQLYPAYFANMNLEKMTLAELTKAQQGLNDEILKEATSKQVKESQSKLLQDLLNTEQALQKAEKMHDDVGIMGIFGSKSGFVKNLQDKKAAIAAELASTKASIENAAEGIKKSYAAAFSSDQKSKGGETIPAVAENNAKSLDVLNKQIEILKNSLHGLDPESQKFKEALAQIHPLEKQAEALKKLIDGHDKAGKAIDYHVKAMEDLLKAQAEYEKMTIAEGKKFEADMLNMIQANENLRIGLIKNSVQRALAAEKEKNDAIAAKQLEANKQREIAEKEQLDKLAKMYGEGTVEVQKMQAEAKKKDNGELLKQADERAKAIGYENKDVQALQTKFAEDKAARDKVQADGDLLRLKEAKEKERQILQQADDKIKAEQARSAESALQVSERFNKLAGERDMLQAQKEGTNKYNQKAKALTVSLKIEDTDFAAKITSARQKIALLQLDLDRLNKKKANGEDVTVEEEQEITDKVKSLQIQQEIDLMESERRKEKIRIEAIKNRTAQMEDYLGKAKQGESALTDFVLALEARQSAAIDEKIKKNDTAIAATESQLQHAAGLTAAALTKQLNEEKKHAAELLKEKEKNTKEQGGIKKTAALTEAIIETASSALKAFDSQADIPWIGPELGIAAAAAATAFGLAKIATISVQQFAGGGVVGAGNMPQMLNGDNVLATLRSGEIVLNGQQQGTIASLAGRNIFQLAGVPNAPIPSLVTPPPVQSTNIVTNQQNATHIANSINGIHVVFSEDEYRRYKDQRDNRAAISQINFSS